MTRALISVPPRARRGEIIEIRCLISHVMESGFRRTQTGAVIPRDILRSFVCTWNGDEIFRAEIHPATAANPFFSFSARATESGRIEFSWHGDHGFEAREAVEIVVE